eukprot:3404999-Rhodomonas_salina.1
MEITAEADCERLAGARRGVNPRAQGGTGGGREQCHHTQMAVFDINTECSRSFAGRPSGLRAAAGPRRGARSSTAEGCLTFAC